MINFKAIQQINLTFFEIFMNTLTLVKPAPAVQVETKTDEVAFTEIPITGLSSENTHLTEIVPYIACLVDPAHFEEAVASHYSQVYVKMPDGKFMRHMKLTGGRFVRHKVDKLPETALTKALPQPIEIKEEINFLPAGKIPSEYFDQIVQFFREVMRLKKADYEAHAWILWEEAKGYYISIPKQTVSKASVSFTYDAEGLPPGAVIVCDIHSHNTMGAFYSGTDNNNDKTGVYFSGVIGKLTDKSYEWVMRFNIHDYKITCVLEDVFAFPEAPVATVPADWLEKVEVQTFAQKKFPEFPGYPGQSQRRYQEVSPLGHGKWTALGSIQEQNQSPSQNASRTGSEFVDPFYPEIGESLWDGFDTANFGSGVNAPAEDNSDPYEFRPTTLSQALAAAREKERSKEREQDELLSQQAEQHIAKTRGVKPPVEVDADEEPGQHSQEYYQYLQEFDKETADAYELIDTFLPDMEGCDEGLMEIINTAYNLLSKQAQTKIQTNGLH